MVKRGKGIDKRFFILGIILFLALLFMVNVGNEALSISKTGYQVADQQSEPSFGETGGTFEKIGDWFKRAFYGEAEGQTFEDTLMNVDVSIIRNVLSVIILLFIFTVLGAAKWPKSRFFAFLISLACAYLGSLIISENQIRTIILGYGALFAAIASVIPLFILVLFSANLLVAKVDPRTGAIKKAQLGQVLIVWILWMFYDLYVLYFVIRTIIGATQGYYAIDYVFAIFLGCSAIATFIILNFRRVRRWMAQFGADMEAEVATLAQQQVASQAAIAQQVRRGAQAATGGGATP